ncbi:MAG: insulinase family protein [Acholeplasmataceae bacterium]
MIILNQDFKTIQLAVYTTQEDEITWRSYRRVLPYLLVNQTEKIKTKREMSEYLENLYEAYFSVQSEVIGNLYITSIILTCIHPNFVDDPTYFDQIVNLFKAVVNPKHNLSASIFEEEKRNLIERWQTLKENKQAYGFQNFSQHFYVESENKISVGGRLSDVKKMSYDSLNQVIDAFNDSPRSYVFNGRFSQELITELNSTFTESNSNNVKPTLVVKRKSRTKTHIDRLEMNQALLYLGYRLPILRTDELNDAAILFNTILGGYANSRLFRIIREEMGLCYAINSIYNNMQGSIVIYAGVNQKERDKSIAAIRGVVHHLVTAGITEEELNEAKENQIHSLKSSFDMQSFQTKRAFSSALFPPVLTLEKRIDKINSVTKKDLEVVANALEFETLYVLQGETDEDNL